MKKEFPTYIDETAMLFDAIAVSGGMRGVQLIVNPDQLFELRQRRVCRFDGVTQSEL